jgi:hypothetical protein
VLLLDCDGHPLRRVPGFVREYRRCEAPCAKEHACDAIAEHSIEPEEDPEED